MKTYVGTYAENGKAMSIHIEAENGPNALALLWQAHPDGKINGELIAEGTVDDDGTMHLGVLRGVASAADSRAVAALVEGSPA